MHNLWLAFITGLTTGGLSCLAIQGGLLASSVAQRSDGAVRTHFRQVAMFIIAKLAVYTILGILLGALGSVIALSLKIQGWLQIAAGLFMLATAARILNLHPAFRYLVISPPRWAYKMMRGKSRDGSLFAPAVLGGLTIFIPCGVTQAMMVVAVASGSPLLGAAIMFAFVLGTSPIFFALGVATVELLQRRVFVYAASAIIMVFAALSISGGMALVGSIYTLQNFYRAATTDTRALAYAQGALAGITRGGVQDVTVEVQSTGYTASATTLKAGVPVRLTLVTRNTQGCTRAFTIPELNISKVLPVSGIETVEFTPTKTGRLAYSCSMGMFTGAFAVIY